MSAEFAQGTLSSVDTRTINPNHPKSYKILQGALFWRKKSSLLETGTVTSSNGAQLLPGKKYRP